MSLLPPADVVVLFTDGSVRTFAPGDAPTGLPELAALLEDSLAAEGAPSMKFPLAPGLALTCYAGGPASNILQAVKLSATAIALADIVTLHTTPDRSDLAAVAEVRRINPRARVWFGAPFNPVVRLQKPRALEAVAAWAKLCVEAGAELLELNGEGNETAPGDWVGNTDAERAQLAALMTELLQSMRAAAPSLPLGFTSHDMPRSFRAPWSEVLREPLALHRPQHYPAEAGRRVGLQELQDRIARSRKQWDALVAAGKCGAPFTPYGAAWSPYLQGHGHDLVATTWAMDQAPIASLWASPGSWDEGGTDALRAMRVIRDDAGSAPGAIARWQVRHGLDPVGTIGPRSRALLNLPATR